MAKKIPLTEKDLVKYGAKKHILRIQESDFSKKHLNQKIRAIKALKEHHEDKIVENDDWRSTYRLPELFGIVERKKSDLLKHLPEVVIDAEENDEYNMAVASRVTLAHFQHQSHDLNVKSQAIESSVDYGTGIKYNGVVHIEQKLTVPDSEKPELYLKKAKNPKKVSVYFGLAPARIDLRDAFPDPSATVDYDPSGQTGMDWFYRRIIFTEDKFKRAFDGDDMFDIKKIEPVHWGNVEDYGIERINSKHEGEEKEMGEKKYVVVFEGWDILNDEHVLIANGKEIYCGAIPYAHKRIPVTFYYNYKRDDSIWGVSEAEINAPFILVKELLINLMIDNAKLSQQPVVAISGDVQFDPDENELEPGALFVLQGLNGGKVGDAIQPLTFGSSVEPAMAVKQIVEDLQIQVTGDDSRALMTNPAELATQTLKKAESLQKRIRANVMLNAIRSERNSVEQQFSNICQFLARPYQDMQGNWKHHVIYVDDFKVEQRTKDDKPTFVPVSGYQGVFKLNGGILKPEYVRFRVIEQVKDAVKKEQEIQALQWWMQTIFSLAQVKPELVQNTDLELLAKQAGRRFTGLDVEAIFNSASRIIDGMSEMDYYIQQTALGIKPIIPIDGNNLRRLERFRRFLKTKEYKLLGKESQAIFTKAITDITKAIREEKSPAYADFVKQRSMAATRKVGEQRGVPGSTGAGGDAVRQPINTANSAEGTVESAPGGVSERQVV